MIMAREKKIVEKADLLKVHEYSKKRKQYRKELLEFKKHRRVPIGPYATFYFESFETMLGQIQEMLYIEKGGEEQLQDELSAYNPLIPKGRELVATLMFEIDDHTLRSDFLAKVGGIEGTVYMNLDKERINATPEKDLDRTSEEGKASSVQFLHFNFSLEQIKKFKNLNSIITLSIDHNLSRHTTKITQLTKNALIKDFI